MKAAAMEAGGAPQAGGPPQVQLGTRWMALGAEVGEMRDSTQALRDGDASLLRARLAEDGFLLLRGLIPTTVVAAGCRCLTDEMARGGWFSDGSDPAERVARFGGPSVVQPEDAAFAATNSTMLRPSEARAVSQADGGAVRRVLEAPELHAAFSMLFDGEPAVTLDYKWFRAIPPPAAVSPAADAAPGGLFHVDSVYMGRGSRRLTTAWIPWHDIAPEDGGLAVLSGSSSLPGFATLRSTYGEYDVSDTDIEAAAGGSFGSDPAELSAFDEQAQWVTTTYRAGDVLLFGKCWSRALSLLVADARPGCLAARLFAGMKTLHGPLTSTRAGPPRIRLSTDTRWQPACDAVDDRHTVGLGPDDRLWVEHSVHGLDWARDSKALNKHSGPWRTMEQAKRSWGLSVVTKL
jgi:hypothetical protein